MRKLLIAGLLILTAAVAAVYITIPAEIKIATATVIQCSPEKLNSCLQDTGIWKRWWPLDKKKEAHAKSVFKNEGIAYQLGTSYRDGASLLLKTSKAIYTTRILLIPYRTDSVAVQWMASFPSSWNPVSRILDYYRAIDMKKNMEQVLGGLKQYADQTRNLYGYPIERTTFTDTILMATRFHTTDYPSTGEVYAAINRLKNFIAAKGAREKDAPMLHVNQLDATHVETMVAICVDREINTEPGIFVSRMVPMKDRFLKTEVTGGPFSIRQAHAAVNSYMEDHFLSQPAIPFEILVTDRSLEKDTSRWKTLIFYPSM